MNDGKQQQPNKMTPRVLAKKLREKGIVYCFKAALNMAYWWLRRFAYLIVRRINWIVPSLRFLLRAGAQPKKRILAIWDFHTVPYSIGDLIVLHERIQILRLTHQVDKVDICFVCEPQHPVRKLGEQGVTPDNFSYHFPTLVSTVYLNPHVGSFFLFDSNDQLEDFIAGNVERYHIWPGFREYVVRHKAYADNFDFIQRFYRENGFIPYLDCRPSTLKWAYMFYEKHVRPEFPVVVHLRHNPLSAASRNAQLDAWLDFFKSCEGRFDVKFVLIGAAREIDERFRHLANVLVAKDYRTTVEQDLVLAYSALIYLGSSSGPSSMAIFSQTPYIIFGYVRANERIRIGENFNFATDMQKLIWKPETSHILMEEFSKLFDRVDKLDWEERAERFMVSRAKETFRSDLIWME